ncbi:unnamed protein product [Linum tenue]|uniref:Uncharacterized protein n=1 Tax=Linum tenue TaxID=586396 RepID=A0AAV0KYG5_9ROSI|nr:unnamed protein product [Linum tenue]
MMIRSAFRLSRAATTVVKIAHSGFNSRKPTTFAPSAAASRSLHERVTSPNANPVTIQMIDYALSLPRAQKSDESYGEAMLVLEQCLASQLSGGEDFVSQNSKGMVLLAMANLSFERGNFNEALEHLRRTHELQKASLGVKVAALEALVGLSLELGNDDASSVLADKCSALLVLDELASTGAGLEVADARAKALKGFVESIRGNFKAAESHFGGLLGNDDCVGSAALSYGEFLHATRNFTMAKELYQKVTEGEAYNKEFNDRNALTACNMASDQVQIAATCALGQLEAHMGKFDDAEETLTKALNRGLYRRAIELLKVPSVDSEVNQTMGAWRDIAALARAGYAEALSVQDNRKSEGEKMKSWAEAHWRNSRLSLAEALRVTESSNSVPVIDARTGRAL